MALYEFISGAVTLVVILDADTLVRQFAAKGLDAQFVDHPEWILRVTRRGAELDKAPISAISVSFFFRLFYEFDPMSQLPDAEMHHIQRLEAMWEEVQANIESGELTPDAIKPAELPVFKPMRWE
mgnify:CR=1 FL=1